MDVPPKNVSLVKHYEGFCFCNCVVPFLGENSVDDNILFWLTEKVANKRRILLPTQGITLTVGNAFFIHISSEFNNEF